MLKSPDFPCKGRLVFYHFAYNKSALLSMVALYLALLGNITDVKIYNINIVDFISLPLLLLFLFRPLARYFFTFSLLFAILFIFTIFYHNNTQDLSGSFFNSGLRAPDLISFSRFVQLVLCAFIITMIPAFLSIAGKGKVTPDHFNKLCNDFLFWNIVFSIFYIFFGILNYVDLSDTFYYGNGRLKGFYVEGGPLGLYFATVAIFSIYMKRYVYSLLFFSIIILSQSKAGYSMYTLGLLFFFFSFVFKLKKSTNTKYSILRFEFWYTLATLFLIVMLVIYFFGGHYVEQMLYPENYLYEKINDTSFVKGRIAGFNIGFNMISQNPYFGVGLGNYSILRNNPEYLGIFPAVYSWDLTGLGGIITLLIENGVFGLLAFCSIVYNIFWRIKLSAHSTFVFLILFLFPFLLGLQLYFQYPWVFLGFFLAKTNIIKKEYALIRSRMS